MTPPLHLLGLFPDFETGGFGGVQTSGREAWRALSSHPSLRAEIFPFTPGTSKLRALARAAAMRRSPDVLLVWHLDLLKLAPVIAPSRRQTVIFLHGIEAWRKLDSVTRRLMRTTSLFLSNSEHTWRRFLRFHPDCAQLPYRIVALGLGEPLTSASPEPAAEPAALMVGRMSRTEDYKGHRQLITIWPYVLSRLPDARLWIAGEGDLRPDLEALAVLLGVDHRVKFFGAIPDQQRDELLARSRALFMPSGAEGFGLVYAEAMRMGRPSLVSTRDAGPEVVNPPEAGLAVDATDGDDLAEAVIRLLTPGADWIQVSKRARARYEANFTARHFAERLVGAILEPVRAAA